MDAKLEQMLINELQPAVKIKRFEYTPMTPKEKEAVNKYIVPNYCWLSDVSEPSELRKIF